MSRVVKASDLEKRGAKRLDGSAFCIPEKVTHERDTIPDIAKVTLDSPAIDTTPIANEIGKLADIVEQTMRTQADALGKISDAPKIDGFEFTVTERDVHGRIVKMKAVRVEN